MGKSAADFRELANFTYAPEDIGCRLASGSFVTAGMVDRAVLHPYDVGHRRGHQFQPYDPRGRRSPEGAPQARADGA